jgi:Ca-activated chloride channel family protein
MAASVYGAAFSFLFVLSAGFAVAGPAWGSRAVSAERSGLEVAVVLDVSRSMMVREGMATRLEAAREGVRNVLRSSPGASFSLVAAKGGAVLLVPMTEDLEAIDSGLDYADPDTLSEVGTDLEKGIKAGLASFTERSGANRVLLLFSDGGEHGSDATKAAAEAKRRHVSIIAVGVGGAEALPVPGPTGAPLLDNQGVARRSALDPRLLKSLASMTGGHYVEAGDPGTKVALQAELASLGRGGKRTEYEVQDRSGLFAILALAFLVARILAGILAIRPAARGTRPPAPRAGGGGAS